jgi:uncharacterized phage infection (PIP) family protein YhgE
MLAGAASAAQLKGQVVGSPYSADVRTAIPVLLSRVSAKRAGLSSPVGIFIVPRRKLVTTPDGRVLPSRLRPGDRLEATARVGGQARHTPYFRLSLHNVVVKRRSKTPSNDELSAAITQLQQQMAAMQYAIVGLGNYVNAGFQALQAQIDTLRSDLATLKANVDALTKQIKDLSSALDQVKAELLKKIGDVNSDLLSRIDGLQAQITALSPVNVSNLENTVNNTILPLLNDPVTGVTTRITSLTTQLSALLLNVLPGQVSGLLHSLQTDLTSTITDLSSVRSDLRGADGIFNTADDLVGQINVNVGVNAGSGLRGSVATLQTSVSALNSANYQAQIDVITSNVSTLSASVTSGQASLSAQIGTLNTLVGGVNVSTLNSSVSALTTRVNNVCTGLIGSNGLATVLNGASLVGGVGTLPSLTNTLTALGANTGATNDPC